MHVIADPQDVNTVYVADVEFFKSTTADAASIK